MRFICIFLLFLLSAKNYSQEYCSTNLLKDLAVIQECDRKQCDKLPTIMSHYGHLGYFNMPSARVSNDGDLTLGISQVPPYLNFFAGFQLFSRVELSGVYRIFKGVQDVILSPHGFGDYADKGVNVKINLLKPEDTDYSLPGIAVGFDDFLGSQFFQANYVVITQEWPKKNVEASLGFGTGRLSGFFGGVAWTPWRLCDNSFYKGISFVAEYDGNNYTNPLTEPHPHGRVVKCPVNFGFKYAFGNYWKASASLVRGNNVAYAISGTFDIGSIKGFFPKINDPLCYFAPINQEPISEIRPKESLVEDMAYALDVQGFTLIKATLEESNKSPMPILRLRVVNRKWLYENSVHKRLGCILALLSPSNVSEVIVVISADSVLCQEYRFPIEALNYYASKEMTEIELITVSPLREVSFPRTCPDILFERSEKALDWGIRPRARTFFGSSRGKFKYEVDLAANVEGFVWYDVFYKLLLSHTVLSSAGNLGNFDMLNPSPVLNVYSDRITYYQKRNFRAEQVYLQRAWTHGCGFHTRIGAGFFDIAYGGFTAEGLYFPVNSNWAFGVAGAVVWKRHYSDWGFTSKIRKFTGTGTNSVPIWVNYDYLSQYFFDIYYRFKTAPLGIKWSVGQFLAGDFGIRTEVFRYFESGLRLSFWYTFTNGGDRLNGRTYFDKGISFSMPLDVIFKETSRARWGYGMSAWLRDVGYRVDTGKELYPTLYEQRDFPVSYGRCN